MKQTEQPHSRQYEREHLKVRVGLCTLTNFFTGESQNISEGGLFVTTYKVLQPGEEIDLEFSLPGEAFIIHVKGVVRWLQTEDEANEQAPGLGIKFVNLSEHNQKTIQRFVNKRKPMLHEWTPS